MTNSKISTEDMEIAVATYFDYRQNLIVPRVSWGMYFNHECDLLILTKNNYAYEVEIKISRSDLMVDRKKKHCHYSDKIKKLYFAIPEYLKKHIDLIPEHAGIIIVSKNENTSSFAPSLWGKQNEKYYCNVERKALSKSKYKMTDKERYNLARLGSMRIWSLKKRLNKL